jgi:Heterokaryon incompatibility protein (HET)
MQDIESLQNREAHFMDSHTSSEATMALAKTWLDQCRQEHPTCGLLAMKQGFLPLRLIDTEPISGSEWRLWVPGRNQHRSVSYMTLSHRWGTASPLKLTRSNMEGLKAGLRLSALPQTFRDAIKVVQRLGQRYLWIDSVCIIQDSLEDWQEQSAAMRDIYTNAVCNIAATSSEDSHGGCFAERNVSDLQCRIPNYLQSSPGQEYSLVSMDLWTDCIERAPLNQRAWVLQERLLAARTIHFGAQQIFWECNEMNACEVFPTKLPSSAFSRVPLSIRGHSPLFSVNTGVPDDESDEHLFLIEYSYVFWNSIVGAYCRGGLMISADKLIALSGLALQLNQIIKDEYFAGMWRKNLHSQLLWHVIRCKQSDGSPSRRPMPYRAPSWSWASIDGLVQPNEFFLLDAVFNRPLIDVVDIKTIPLTDNFTGQIKDGYLVIRGVLIQASLQVELENVVILSIGTLGRRSMFDLDVSHKETLPDLVCVPIEYYGWQEDDDGELTVDGLILQRRRPEEDLYVRLGKFRLNSRADCKELGLVVGGEKLLRRYPPSLTQQTITIV